MSLTTSEMTPADIAACTGGGRNNDNGFGGDNAWWIIVLLLFGRGGFGGFGGGNGGGGNCGCSPCATQADVRAAVDQQTLISKLDQQTYGLADSTYALNNTISSGFHGVDNAICNLGYNIQQSFSNLAAQNANCCCETQRLIERGFADTNYNLATQACDTRHAIYNSTRDITENANANTRAILDFLTQDKISTLQAENQKLQLAASQANQNNVIRAAIDASTAEIIRRTGNDCPVPAYVVPNPNCCYGNPVGVSYGGCGFGNNGCGCAC